MTDISQRERSAPSDGVAGRLLLQTTAVSRGCDVSVVVLTWNREVALRRCLDSLAAQSFPRERMEVVLVDVSDLPVHGLVEEFAGRLQMRHVVFFNQGVAGNRNHGASVAAGRWLAFLDDDCVADSEWLSELMSEAHDDHRTLVGGRITIASDAGLWATVGQVVLEVVHAHFNPSSGPVTFLPGGCILASRERFLALEGLDSRFGLLGAEDRDLCDRWREAGGFLAYCHSAVVRHDHRTTLRGFVRQQFNFGRGACRYRALRRQRPRESSPIGRTDSERLHSLLREPLRKLPLWRSWQVRLSVPVWRLAYTSGFLWQTLIDWGKLRSSRDGRSRGS